MLGGGADAKWRLNMPMAWQIASRVIFTKISQTPTGSAIFEGRDHFEGLKPPLTVSRSDRPNEVSLGVPSPWHSPTAIGLIV